MAEQRVQRRLAAILAADVVGYSRQMARDEEGTLARLKSLRGEVFDPVTKRYGGRVFKITGDGALAEFSSATDAVRCAVEIQRAQAARNAELPEGARIDLRIGISLGDVMVEGADLYGNGVNVAARMEGLADSGGICVSGNVQEHLGDAKDIAFEDLGAQTVKNIDRPVRAWRVNLQPAPAAIQDDAPLPLPDKPSIAVLPFTNMSSDPEQEFFGDGLAEDIITTLSKISNIFVIARNSSFAFKGRAVDLRQVAAELGVRYVLEGSVRASGNRLRVTAQLIDAIDGGHLWAERYDRRPDDIFDIQDEIMREIVTGLRIELLDEERGQVWLRGTDSVEAWSLAMQGYDMMLEGSAAKIAEGRSLLERAVTIDPGYAMAHANIAHIHYIEGHFGFSDDPSLSFQLARDTSQRALELDPESLPTRMFVAATAIEMGLDPGGLDQCRRIIRQAPNDAAMKIMMARMLTNMGELSEAEQLLRDAMRLNPYCPIFYFGILANVLERQGQDEEAIALLRRALARSPSYFSGHLRLASLLGLAGELDDARYHAAEARRLNPRFNRQSLAGYYPTEDAAALERFVGGLEAAGMVLS